ncbi:hypothetical protein ZEAMMB73_Zm00001d009766 [Zea mays]|uniref:Uncharacterized protein n=1 Tax=Zea mays TaxID=4577 RepID=A0A1D6FLX1_MAIZE|nr:hypothetical protein ZEAMMB73_Zm00001d009766 [Zea mays]
MIGPTRSMTGSGRLNQNRIVLAIRPFPPFVLFDDVQDVNSLPQIKSVFARVVVKFPRCHDSQHFILQDITDAWKPRITAPFILNLSTYYVLNCSYSTFIDSKSKESYHRQIS